MTFRALRCFLIFPVFCAFPLFSRTPVSRILPDPYYPQEPAGELRLNYYYDRSGRWVKFSDWIPFQQHKYAPRFFEDFYELYGLGHHYNVAEVKGSIYFLVQALTHRFRHPRDALCRIETEAEYHRYRNLLFMHVNLLIMRMHLRLGSLYDKRHLYFHDLDFADDLEISFLIARTYYREARKYWKEAKKYARVAVHPVEMDLPQIETERYQILRGELNYDRIIGLHLARVEGKLKITGQFLDEEGRPRPVKERMQEDLEKLYDEDFSPDPLSLPRLDPEWQEEPLFPEEAPLPDGE